MGQVLHGSVRTTEAIHRAIQHRQASLRDSARRFDINPETIGKWREPSSVTDHPTGPKVPRSIILSAEHEALVVPAAVTRCCRWTTVFPPCWRRSSG